jgi:hypothetical protein
MIVLTGTCRVLRRTADPNTDIEDEKKGSRFAEQEG